MQLLCKISSHRWFQIAWTVLRFLVRLCSDLGLKDVQEYSLKLKKAEKLREAKRQRELSSGSRRSSGGSNGSKGRGSTNFKSKDCVLSGERGKYVLCVVHVCVCEKVIGICTSYEQVTTQLLAKFDGKSTKYMPPSYWPCVSLHTSTNY